MLLPVTEKQVEGQHGIIPVKHRNEDMYFFNTALYVLRLWTFLHVTT